MATMATIPKTLNWEARPLNRLAKFFSRYPPAQFSAESTGQVIPTSKQRIEMGMKPLSSTSLPQSSSIPKPHTTPVEESDISVVISDETFLPRAASTITKAVAGAATSLPPNPFLPYKNPETGRWRGAKVGLRQQADLFKLARAHDLEHLMPASIKSSTYKQNRALERGLAVKGTGEGQRVKGHKWERQKASTLEKRRKAMEEMPGLVREWEQRGHGRGWKKYPSK